MDPATVLVVVVFVVVSAAVPLAQSQVPTSQQGPICLQSCAAKPTATLLGSTWRFLNASGSPRQQGVAPSSAMLQLVMETANSTSAGCLTIVRVGKVLTAAGTDVRPCNGSSPLQRWVIDDPSNGTLLSSATPSELTAVGAAGTQVDINNHQTLNGTALEMAPPCDACARWRVEPLTSPAGHFQLQLLSWGAIKQCVWHVQCSATHCGDSPPPTPPPLPPPPSPPVPPAPPEPPAPPAPNTTYQGYPVGLWEGQTDVLPIDDKYRPPTNPLLGNGHLGVMISSEPFSTIAGGPPGGPAFNISDGRGPGRPTQSQGGLPVLNFFLGSNAMWRMYSATEQILGSKLMGDRVGTGGLTLRLGDLFSGETPGSVVFRAEQRIANGELYTSHRGTCGEFETWSRIHPVKNVLLVTCSWTPWTSKKCTPPRPGSKPATVEVATWTFVQTTLVDHFHTPWLTPLSMAVSAGREADAQWVTRQALPWNVSSPRIVRAALATSFAGATLVARKMYADDWIAEANTALALPRGGVVTRSTMHITTALAENLAEEADSTFVVAERAVGMAVEAVAAPASITAAADKFWSDYWNRSKVTLPSRPLLQRVWAGANYALGCIASFDSQVPAPGLDGPFVFTDQPGWNGDYTLDYNFQSPWFGIFSSNHEELAASYFSTVFRQIPGAAAQAQRFLSAHGKNISSCPSTALKFQQHISAYGGGDLNTPWEITNGQFMQWTGSWTCLLFIEHFEYTRDVATMRNYTIPLLSGLLDYWSCYLSKIPDASFPDGYRYDDKNDRYAEPPPAGTNPSPPIALIRRIASALLSMAAVLKVPAHSFASDVLTHLAPLPSFTNKTDGSTVWIFFEGADPVTAWSSGWPIHPAQIYSTASSTDILTIAQDTILHYKSGRVQLEYAALVRAGLRGSVRGRHRGSQRALTADLVVNRMEAEVAPLLMPNLVLRESVTGSSGWLENNGLTLAINEMLVAGHPTDKKEAPWLVEVFPGWPSGEPAAFRSLRVKGGFSVTASYTPPSIVSPIEVKSHAGELCAILDPSWVPHRSDNVGTESGPARVAVSTIDGTHIETQWVDVNSGDALVFNTSVGETYLVSW